MAYTDKEVAVLTKTAEKGSITYEDAVRIGTEIGKSTKSVIAKALSLELPYERKPVEPKRPKGLTKTDLVASIKARMDREDLDLTGLEKATAQALNKLLEAL